MHSTVFKYYVTRHNQLQPKDLGAVGSEGNLLLDRAAGARIILTPHVRSERDTGPTQHEYATVTKTLHEMVTEYAEKLRYIHTTAFIMFCVI